VVEEAKSGVQRVGVVCVPEDCMGLSGRKLRVCLGTLNWMIYYDDIDICICLLEELWIVYNCCIMLKVAILAIC
jgi:hypothetical protein